MDECVGASKIRKPCKYAIKYDPESLYLRSLSLRIPWALHLFGYSACGQNAVVPSPRSDPGIQEQRLSALLVCETTAAIPLYFSAPDCYTIPQEQPAQHGSLVIFCPKTGF